MGELIREELWQTQLSERTGLQLTTSTQLWSALCTQLEQRLLSGSSLLFPELGAWALEEHRECIAHLTDGRYFLVPPHLALCLSRAEARSPRAVSLILLTESLSLQTEVTTSAVHSWLEQICQLTRELLSSGVAVTWPQLGEFAPLVDATGVLQGYEFLPTARLEAQLNKPFSMFAPVEVSAASPARGLQLVECTSLDELYPRVAQRVLFAPTPAASPEAPSQPEPASASTPTAEPEPAPSTPELLPPTPPPAQPELVPVPPASEHPARVDLPASGAPTASDEPPRGLYWVILLGGIALASALFFWLLSLQRQPHPEPAPVPPAPAEVVAPTPPLPDSLPIPTPDSVEIPPLPPAPPAPASPTPRPTVAPAERAEQVRLHAGDRLSRLALKKYGHKVFWVYIYQENRSQLSDPDNIPVGITITLPPASKYQINAQDTNSINKALILQRQLLR